MNVAASRANDATFERLGIVLEPDGTQAEREGVINPGCTRGRDGQLLLLPRVVAEGNVSRIARCRTVWSGDDVTFVRDGFALEPQAPYERRAFPGGYGCEDPRVTFIPALDRYLMAYCAYGPTGARIAVAISSDARTWERLGPIDFHGKDGFGDKDAAFFPEVVTSPSGVASFALLHRPTLHTSVASGRAMLPSILATPPSEREGICIAYVPAAAVSVDVRALLDIAETSLLMQPDGAWGVVKIGAGPPPVRTAAGWLLMYHGIDPLPEADAAQPAMQYRAGIALLDIARPDRVLYRAPQPILAPELPQEREGIVDDVVFPTGIDPRPDLGPHIFDIYYGMGDFRIGRGRLRLANPAETTRYASDVSS